MKITLDVGAVMPTYAHEYDENGKPRYVATKKPFVHKTPKQMAAWYNKLQTDSSEYKMWGNGIALPCAVDVLERIVRACKRPSPPVSP